FGQGGAIVQDHFVLGTQSRSTLHRHLVRGTVIGVDGQGWLGGGELDEERAHVGQTTRTDGEHLGDHLLDVAHQIGMRLREVTGGDGDSHLIGRQIEDGGGCGLLERLSHRTRVVEYEGHLVRLDELLAEVFLHRLVHTLLHEEAVVGRGQLALVSESPVHSLQLLLRHDLGDVGPGQSVIRLDSLLPLARLLLHIRVNSDLVRDVQIRHDHTEHGRAGGDRRMGEDDVLLECLSIDEGGSLVRDHDTQTVICLGEQRLLPLVVHKFDQRGNRDAGLLVDLGECLLGGRRDGVRFFLLHLLLRLRLFHLLFLGRLLDVLHLEQRALLHRLLHGLHHLDFLLLHNLQL
ncbi:hypothetical protein PENTCL1PPCAC_8479, partial [Pristionchus entomophagus]